MPLLGVGVAGTSNPSKAPAFQLTAKTANISGPGHLSPQQLGCIVL